MFNGGSNILKENGLTPSGGVSRLGKKMHEE